MESASESDADEGTGGDAAELDGILEGLCAMFKEKHGRDPTADEVHIWMQQLKEAADDGGLDIKG